MPWNLGDYVEKVLKNDKKTAQKLKIFTKIYCTSGLAILECIPFGDFDPLESTNLGVFVFFFFFFFNYPFILDAPKWKFQN